MDVQIGPGGDAAETMKDELLSSTTHTESPIKASEEKTQQLEEDACSKAGSETDTGMSVSGSDVILTAKVMKEENDLEKLEKKEEEKEEAQLQKQKELWSHMDEDTKEMRYLRLQTLLTKSNLYTEYLLQRMERQKEEEAKRKEREIKKMKKSKEKETEENKSTEEISLSCSQGQRKMSLRAPVPRSQLSSPRTPLSSQNKSLPTSPKADNEVSEDPIPSLESENINHRNTRERNGTAPEDTDFQDCLRDYLGEDVIPLSTMLATGTEQTGSASKRGRKRKTDEAGAQALTNVFKPTAKKRKRDIENNDMETMQGKTDTSNSHSHMTKRLEAEAAGKLETKRDEEGKVIKPALLTGGELRPYQVDGVNWLRILYENGVNGILADEMGLGKTIQCIAALADFIHIGCTGPFLVIAPLSTLPNWKNEFQKFAPMIPTLFYHGSKDERANLRRKIYKKHTVMAGIMIQPVVLTSYEIAMRDSTHIRNCNWNYLIVDEGHRLKNRNCRLIRELKQYRNAHRLLLTGTPLQNNLSELWSLLNFLLPEIFDDMGSFETWFDVEVISDEAADEAIIREEKKKNILGMLHQILTPFMLRRVKSDVDLDIPPKKEIMVFAPLSEFQEEFYKDTVDRTIVKKLTEKNESLVLYKSPKQPEELTLTGRPRRSVSKKSIDYKAMLECEEEDSDVESWVECMVENSKSLVTKKEEKPKTSQLNISLRNVMMQLRKVCNHPYLIEYPLDEAGNYKVDENLIQKCGKMIVLDKMLTELRKRGHKVLIFSQMTRMMDILQDYLNFKGMTYCRLDGQTPVEDRRVAMDSFNNDADMFAFLLSTKAGGLGINLTGGDTVVIYDSDWNPQNDLQAQDRCHRIGQTKPVMVYRLVTANTIDQKIVERAAAKRKLEKMIIKKGKFKSGISSYSSELKPLNPDELMELLKSRDYQGTVEGGSVISEKELEALLDRSDMIQQFENIKQGQTVEADEPMEDVLRSGSKESCKLFQTVDFDAGGTTFVSQNEQDETTSQR